MRYELQAILWVSTAILLLPMFFFGAAPSSDLVSAYVGGLPEAVGAEDAAGLPAISERSNNIVLEDVPPIFRLGSQNSSEEPAPQGVVPADILTLRGVVFSSGLSKALVANGEQVYALLSVGDEAFGRVLIELKLDRAVLRNLGTSELETILLRGANESSE